MGIASWLTNDNDDKHSYDIVLEQRVRRDCGGEQRGQAAGVRLCGRQQRRFATEIARLPRTTLGLAGRNGTWGESVL